MVQRILMMVDGSFAAEASARYSLALAEACGAELELLFVADDWAPRGRVASSGGFVLELWTT